MPYHSLRDRPGPAASSAALRVGAWSWARARREYAAGRVLDAVPGAVAWVGLALVVIGAVLFPRAIIMLAALLSAYSALRFLAAAVANLKGLRLIRRWERIGWVAEYARRVAGGVCPNALPRDAVHHLVIIPNYHESLATLRETLTALARQAPARRAMTVVLAMEQGEAAAEIKGQVLRAEYVDRFAHFFVVEHPSGMVGELQCKSANQAWAARWAAQKLTRDLGYDRDHILVTAMDADTIWHPATFAALTTLYAAAPRRYATFWQAPIRYHRNVWRINPLMRLLHAYSSAWELAYLAAPWWQALPMSSYSLSLRLLDGVGYWDPDVIADEWHMYIKTFFQRGGAVQLEPVFLPFCASATGGSSLWRAVKARYWQTQRHAWGAKEIGYALRQVRDFPAIPLRRRWGLLLRVAHDNLLAGAGWVIMLLGPQLPLLLHGDLLRGGAARSVVLPLALLQVAVAIVSGLMITFWWMDRRQRPAPAAPLSWRDHLGELASLPLLAVMTFVCVALPVLHAQTQLLLGIPLTFRVTPKS